MTDANPGTTSRIDTTTDAHTHAEPVPSAGYRAVYAALDVDPEVFAR